MGSTVAEGSYVLYQCTRQSRFFGQSIDLCSLNRIIQLQPPFLLRPFLPPLITSIAIASCPTSPQPPPPPPPMQSCPRLRLRSLPLAYRCRSHHFSYSAMRVTEQMAESEATIDRERGREQKSGRGEDRRTEVRSWRGTKSVREGGGTRPTQPNMGKGRRRDGLG